MRRKVSSANTSWSSFIPPILQELPGRLRKFLRVTARNFLEDPDVKAIVVLTRDVTSPVNCMEGLTNAIKHSGAGTISVWLWPVGGAITASIADDGTGFDVAKSSPRASAAGRIGLLSMRERAALAGGSVEVDSFIGRGTCISATFPRSISTPLQWLQSRRYWPPIRRLPFFQSPSGMIDE